MRPSPDQTHDHAFGDHRRASTSLETFACHSGLPSGVEGEHVALVGADRDQRRVGARRRRTAALPALMRQTACPVAGSTRTIVPSAAAA